MASTVELDENFFTCTICNDNYDDPRSLPCLHSFCRSCLSQHICYSAMESPPSFLCPVCRGLILVPAAGKPMVEWAEFFPGNFWLKDLMSQTSATTSTQQGGSGSLTLYTCSEHPKEQVSMFCISCQAVVCNVCISAKHSDCSGLVILVKNEKDFRKFKASVERLDKEIAVTQTQSDQVVNELSYLTRQRDKAWNAIENHAATFILKLDRAKKDLVTKLDSEYHDMKRNIDKQIATDNGRLLQLKGLRAAAQELMQKTPDAGDAQKMDDVINKVNASHLCSGQDDRPHFERMRATFSPDYSWHGRDITLGAVAFYNSKLPAGSAEGETDDVPTLTRSGSSAQLTHPSSTDLRHSLSTSQPDRIQKRISAPQQQRVKPLQRRISSPQLLQQKDAKQRPLSEPYPQQTDDMHRSISSPWLHRNNTIESANSFQQNEADLKSPTPNGSTTSTNNLDTLKPTETAYEDSESQIQKNSMQKSLNSPPMFFCGDENIRPYADSASGLTKEMPDHESADKTTGTECEHDVHPVSSSGAQSSTERIIEVISTQVLSRFPLKSEWDERLPHITSLIVTANEYVMVADSANKSIKTFKTGKPVSAISLQHKPYGLAASSEDRAVISTPECKELIVISSGEEPKIISRTKMQKCYSRLMNYRPGITAAVCPDLGCIDLVTLQGRTMKSFRIFDQPCGDIPFFVDSDQNITVWDSTKFCLISISKSGKKLYENIPDYLKDKDVAGLACDSTGFVYIIYDSRVAKVSRSVDYVSGIDNVFSCQCMCVTSKEDICVAETGGECKILHLP